MVLPISRLIQERVSLLELTSAALVRRMGYRNETKGLRRLRQILDGDLGPTTQEAVQRLPQGLGVAPEVVWRAVKATRQRIREDTEATERAAFKPFGVILTEKTIPRPIFVAVATGASKWKRIELTDPAGGATYREQALVVVQNRMTMFGGSLPMFGRVTGFVVNYEYDLAVEYDTVGDEVTRSTRSPTIGACHSTLKNGRHIDSIFSIYPANPKSSWVSQPKVSPCSYE